MMKKKVLILEVNEKNFTTLEKILKISGYESIAYDESVGFEGEDDEIDIVLVNTQVDYVDITKVHDKVSYALSVEIPVIYLDNSEEVCKDLVQKCFLAGASDFIKRPFDSKEILARINYHYKQKYNMSEHKLRIEKLASLATVDQLSKLTSKMHMQSILNHQLSNYKRYKTPSAILYIGLISVDRIVGTFGFEYGEKLIRSFSKVLKDLLRDSDAISRWHGSNFMVLLSSADAKKAEVVAKKLNTSLSSVEIMKDTKPLLAYGITEFSEDDSIEELEQRAIYALKEAKKQEYERIHIC